MDDFWRDFPYKEADLMRPDAANYYRNAIYQPFVPLSTEAKDKMLELIKLLVDSIAITNFKIIREKIINWEIDLQTNSGHFSQEELNKLFSSSSIARYGSFIWMKRSDTTDSNSLARGFWNWVMAVIGAVVAITIAVASLGSLTVAGYIIYGAIGAYGGYYLGDLFYL